MELIDHKEQATSLLASIHLDTGDVYGQTPEARGIRLALAQIQVQLLMADATTKMAEQTRIANLIAITAMSWPTEGPDVTKQWDGESDTKEWRSIRNEIAESLGLA